MPLCTLSAFNIPNTYPFSCNGLFLSLYHQERGPKRGLVKKTSLLRVILRRKGSKSSKDAVPRTLVEYGWSVRTGEDRDGRGAEEQEGGGLD